MVESTKENRVESTEEKVGEGVGGVTGAVVGAGLGSAAGPIGTILGGIAGAVGGWWAGEKVGRAFDDWTDRETSVYRRDWERNRVEELSYDDAKVGYGIGHAARRNPDYAGRSFDDIEDDIRLNWHHDRYEYVALRPYIERGYRGD